MSRSLSLRIKSPTGTVYQGFQNYSNSNRITEDMEEMLDLALGNMVVRNLAPTIESAKYMSWHLLATVFQRVVSRTPIDEDYYVKYKNGTSRNYKRDDNSCKLDWFIQKGFKKIYVTDIIEQCGDIFKTYNDASSIKLLEGLFANLFKGSQKGDVKATIGNDNPHFAVLEYGGITGDPNVLNEDAHNPPDLLSEEAGQKHRMKNGRSIQAPFGMLRITIAEIESIIEEAGAVKVSNKRSNKTMQRRTLSKIVDQLSRSSQFSTEDLEEILG